MCDTFDEAMAKEGINGTMRKSTAYLAVKRAILKHPEYFVGMDIGEDLGSAMTEAANLCDALRKQHGVCVDDYIHNEANRDAVRVFNSTLHIVQNTFGADKMTDEVIKKAIEAGSYMAYRSIMGEAVPPSNRRY